MNHALLRRDGAWTSFGLHLPSAQWSDIYRTLVKAYGSQNVTYVFWEYDQALTRVADVELRMNTDVRLANEAQRRWDNGGLREADRGNGTLNVACGVRLLRKEPAQAVTA